MQHVAVLLAFLVGLSVLQEQAYVSAAWPVTAAVMALYLVVSFTISYFNSRTTLRAFGGDESRLSAAIRRHNMLRHLIQAWLIGGLALVIAAGYGDWIENTLGLGDVPLVGQLLAVLPYCVALILHWLAEYPFHRALLERIWRNRRLAGQAIGSPNTSCREYLDYNVRHQLLFVAVPISLILLAQDLIWRYGPRILARTAHQQTILAAATIIAAAGVFYIAPVLIVRIWRTSSLVPGPLRDELERMCRKLNLHFRDILVWRSGNMIANAGVMGVRGSVRYILLSDLLLEALDDAHIKAVFAHEAGHVIRHHIAYMALFAAGAGLLTVSAGQLAVAAGLGPWFADVGSAAVLAVMWIFLFGWLSRRLERQSDVIAAWACSIEQDEQTDGRIDPRGAGLFASALQQVAYLNGTPPNQWSWRHGSIADRINYVLGLAARGSSIKHVDEQMSRVKICIWLMLMLGAALAMVNELLTG